MKIDNLKIIVAGSLNTDIVAMKVPEFLKPGQLSYGGSLHIGPGGKSRNIAQMISVLLGKNKVVMLGVTSKDPYNLWKIPVKALKKAGVITDFIKIMDFKDTKKFPGIAMIIVDKEGQNQIYVLPESNEIFNEDYVMENEKLFRIAGENNGLLILTFEITEQGAFSLIEMAERYNLKIFLDPGGIRKEFRFEEFINDRIFFLKPNEFEAEILTGIRVKDFNSAKKAATVLIKKGVKNVFITHGEKGGYLFTQKESIHIKIPSLKIKSDVRDATGCGDQVSATVCAKLIEGEDIINACKHGIIAGTIQYYKKGIVPVTDYELHNFRTS